MHIQLIIEFEKSFGKYHPDFPKNTSGVFLGHSVIQTVSTHRYQLFHLYFQREELYSTTYWKGEIHRGHAHLHIYILRKD